MSWSYHPAHPATPVLRWNEVLGSGRWIRERQRGLLDLSIGGGQASIVLAQVFLPRGNTEELDETVRALAVPEQLPAYRPGLQSRAAQVLHRLQECRLALRRDDELHRHHDRPRVELGFEG